jgi:hypothetical protein
VQALFPVGHGPTSAEDHAEWMTNLRPVADSVARITGFRDVKLGLLPTTHHRLSGRSHDGAPPLRWCSVARRTTGRTSERGTMAA